jgi:hypothetical protein
VALVEIHALPCVGWGTKTLALRWLGRLPEHKRKRAGYTKWPPPSTPPSLGISSSMTEQRNTQKGSSLSLKEQPCKGAAQQVVLTSVIYTGDSSQHDGGAMNARTW